MSKNKPIIISISIVTIIIMFISGFYVGKNINRNEGESKQTYNSQIQDEDKESKIDDTSDTVPTLSKDKADIVTEEATQNDSKVKDIEWKKFIVNESKNIVFEYPSNWNLSTETSISYAERSNGLKDISDLSYILVLTKGSNKLYLSYIYSPILGSSHICDLSILEYKSLGEKFLIENDNTLIQTIYSQDDIDDKDDAFSLRGIVQDSELCGIPQETIVPIIGNAVKIQFVGNEVDLLDNQEDIIQILERNINGSLNQRTEKDLYYFMNFKQSNI